MQPDVRGVEAATWPPSSVATAEDAPQVQADVDGAVFAGELQTEMQVPRTSARAPTAASFVPRFFAISRMVGGRY